MFRKTKIKIFFSVGNATMNPTVPSMKTKSAATTATRPIVMRITFAVRTIVAFSVSGGGFFFVST